MSNKVLENIAQNYDNVRKGVYDVMGGQVLEYETKTIYNEGQRERARRIAIRLHEKNNSIYDIADAVGESIDLVQQWIDEYEHSLN